MSDLKSDSRAKKVLSEPSAEQPKRHVEELEIRHAANGGYILKHHVRGAAEPEEHVIARGDESDEELAQRLGEHVAHEMTPVGSVDKEGWVNKGQFDEKTQRELDRAEEAEEHPTGPRKVQREKRAMGWVLSVRQPAKTLVSGQVKILRPRQAIRPCARSRAWCRHQGWSGNCNGPANTKRGAY